MLERYNELPNMLNTPGIYFAIGYILGVISILHGLPQKIKGVKKWIIILTIGVFLAFFTTVTKNTAEIAFPFFVSCNFLITFSMIFLIADLSLINKFYFTVRAFMYGEFVASVAWQLLVYAIYVLCFPLSIKTNLIFCLPVYIILPLIAWIIEGRNADANKEFEASKPECIGEVAIFLFIYVISNLSFVYRYSPFSATVTNEIILLRAIVDSSGAVILFLYDIVLHQMQAVREVEILQSMLKEQYSNYKVSRESVELINRKYHDLKHQIAILREEGMSGKSKEYLDEMEADIKKYEAENKTGNHVLDIILTSKSLLCQKHHIELTVVADGTAVEFMDPMDMSSLFGNALDNAIEAVRKIDKYEERLIHFTIVKKKQFAVIEVENRYIGDIRFRFGIPQTSKNDSAYHGFGVKSMRQTVEKYGGSMNLDTNDGWFHVHIILPSVHD